MSGLCRVCPSPRTCEYEDACRLGAAPQEPSVPPSVSAQEIFERIAERLDRRAAVLDGPAGHALSIVAEEYRALAKELDR